MQVSFGPDDYTGVSWSNASEDRKILIGWMSKWTYAANTPSADDGWRGAMTLPRELGIRDEKLMQNALPEVLARRGEKIEFNENSLSFCGDSCEIEVEINLNQLTQTQVGFRLRVDVQEATRILYDYDTIQHEIFFDRSQPGQGNLHAAFSSGFHQPLTLKYDVLKLRIFLDRCSVEVFVQDGELYGAMLIFPSPASQKSNFWTGRTVASTTYLKWDDVGVKTTAISEKTRHFNSEVV